MMAVSRRTKDLELLSSPDCVRVLVVDDEHAIADTLARILRHRGFNTLSEYSAQGAAQAAQHFKPDVLITDIVMPGLSGIDLAEWFSKAQPGCQIILTSANLHHLDPSDLDFHPAQEIVFLPKPLRVSDLTELLDRKRSAA
jgi:DNA-binding NtrC family response regulator